MNHLRSQLVHHALALLVGVLSAPAIAQAAAKTVASDTGSAQVGGASTAGSAAAHRKAEHERIARERHAIRARKQADEAACYQRFAVEGCLRRVREEVRESEGRLRVLEIELNDAERKEKAAQQLKSIEEKQRTVPTHATASSDATVLRGNPPAPKEGKISQRDRGAAKGNQEATRQGPEAAQRAREQRMRVHQQAQEQEQAERGASNAARAAQARERHAKTLRAADERKARVEKARAEAQALGRVPAAPLPAGSAAR